MSVTIYTFASDIHYSDYVTKLRFPSYQRRVTQPDESTKVFEIEKPLGIGIDRDNILDTDWKLIEKLFRERYKTTVSGCPLCFWNSNKFAWLRPVWFEKEKKPNYLMERWALCIHRIWDINFISRVGNKGRYPNWEMLDHFKHFNIDWKKWINILESRNELGGDGNGKFLKGSSVPEDRMIEEPVF